MPEFRVTDMTCDACVRALTAAVRSVDAAASLTADLTTKHVAVASAKPAAALAGAMREAGFAVEAA